MFKPLETLETGERNIFVRIGLTRSEWDKLGVMGVGKPHEAVEKVLELVLRKHLLLVERGLMAREGDS